MKKTEGFERIFCFGSTLPLTYLLYFITLFSIAGKGKENISPGLEIIIIHIDIDCVGSLEIGYMQETYGTTKDAETVKIAENAKMNVRQAGAELGGCNAK